MASANLFKFIFFRFLKQNFPNKLILISKFFFIKFQISLDKADFQEEKEL